MKIEVEGREHYLEELVGKDLGCWYFHQDHQTYIPTCGAWKLKDENMFWKNWWVKILSAGNLHQDHQTKIQTCGAWKLKDKNIF